MNADDLRVLQAPLKDRYRKEPDAAVVTLKAEGRIGEGIACRVHTGKALVEAGLHPATGGSGEQACPGDMLLQALVRCARPCTSSANSAAAASPSSTFTRTAES
jgi:hypothetical protein